MSVKAVQEQIDHLHGSVTVDQMKTVLAASENTAEENARIFPFMQDVAEGLHGRNWGAGTFAYKNKEFAQQWLAAHRQNLAPAPGSAPTPFNPATIKGDLQHTMVQVARNQFNTQWEIQKNSMEAGVAGAALGAGIGGAIGFWGGLGFGVVPGVVIGGLIGGAVGYFGTLVYQQGKVAVSVGNQLLDAVGS